MKKVFKSKFLKSLLGVVALSPIIALPVARLTSNTENSYVSTSLNANAGTNSKITDDAKNWKNNTNDVTKTANYSFNNLLDKDGNLNLSSNKQDVTFDQDNMSSFATITSSSATENKADQITKYMMTNQLQPKENTTDADKYAYAGSPQWIVKKSDLSSAIGANDSQTTLSAIQYSNGGIYVSKALFVILHSNDTAAPGSFVFKIKWENDGGTGSSMNDKDQKAGSYKLAAYLSDSIKYNYMALQTGSTHSIEFLELKDLTSTNIDSATNTFNINYLFLGLDSVENPTTSQTGYKYTVSTSILNSKYDTTTTYKPIYTYTNQALNQKIYIMYQAEEYKDTTADKYVLNIQLPIANKTAGTNYSDISVTDANNITNTDISNLGFTANDKIAVTTNLYGSQYLDVMFSKKSDGVATGNYGYVKIDMAASTGKPIEVKKIENNATTNAYIKSFTRRYSTTNQALGYFVLDANNRVYSFDTNMENPELLYDFGNNVINFGNISRVITTISNASWFAQLDDATFVMMNGSTMVGQWDSLAKQDSFELPAIVSPKAQADIDPSVIYKKVKSDSANAYDATFINYLNDGNAYKDFLDISFQDPRLTQNPDIIVEIKDQSNFPSSTDQKYPVTLVFKQKLKKINYAGEVTDSNTTKTVTLATQTYVFNNAPSTLYWATEKDTNGTQYGTVPAFLENKLPSEITTEEIKSYLIVSTNLDIKDSYIRKLRINDSNGSMTVVVTIPYIWMGGTLTTNYSSTWTFEEGTFASNPLGATGNVTAIDDEYINKTENAAKKSSLEAQYGAVLASSVSQDEMLNSFVSFGAAFNQQSNYDNGIISPKEEWVVNIIPNDREGYATIDLTIPQVANKKNVRLQFDTPKVFLTNANANANVFFSFKNNDLLTDTTTTKAIIDKTKKASVVASKLNTSGSSDRDTVVATLRDYAEFSDYFANYINDGTINVIADGNDTYGSLKITIETQKNGDKLPGFSSSKIEANYLGFSQAINLTNDDFKMKTTLGNVSDILAIEVTEDQLRNTYDIFNGTNSETLNKISNISLTPSSVNGTLLVSVTLTNYVENGTVLPTKTFNTLYSGFKSSKEPSDMIVFKSFLQLQNENPNATVSAMTPSGIVKSLDANNNLQKLQYLTNISTQLANKLTNEDVSIILTPNDASGILTINATVRIDGTTTAFNYQLECYDNGTATPVINMIQDTTTNTDLQKLKEEKLPSQVTSQDAALLYSFENVSNSYVKETVLTPDDATGTLVVSVTVKTNTGTELASSSQTFSGFREYKPIDEGTQWWVVVVSTIVPAIVLSIPIIVFGILQERKNMKRIARRLERTLEEKYREELAKNRKRY